jgi:hypothetical protein
MFFSKNLCCRCNASKLATIKCTVPLVSTTPCCKIASIALTHVHSFPCTPAIIVVVFHGIGEEKVIIDGLLPRFMAYIIRDKITLDC